MGRLIDPGVGELSDRLSILCLKCLYGRQGRKDVSHFETERAAILLSVRKRLLGAVWLEAYSELAAVNSALWHAEDVLRALRHEKETGGSEPAVSFMEIAFLIQDLNDRRAGLVAKINKEAGDPTGEKL